MDELKETPNNEAPDLAQGLYLENLGVTLEWYTSHRQARVLLGLEDWRPDKDTLSWKQVQCLGGLSCSIAAKFILDPAHDPEKRCLRLVEFRVHPAQDEPLERLYNRIRSHLKRRMGEPTLDYEGEEGYLRSFVEWDSEQVMLMWKIIKTEDGESCQGELWRKPFPSEYLKLTLTQF